MSIHYLTKVIGTHAPYKVVGNNGRGDILTSSAPKEVDLISCQQELIKLYNRGMRSKGILNFKRFCDG